MKELGRREAADDVAHGLDVWDEDAALMPDSKRLRALFAERHLRRLRHAVRVDAEAFGLERDIVSSRAHLAVERRRDLAARLHAAVLRVVLVDLDDAAVAAGAGAVDERSREAGVQRLDASRLVGVEAACASHHAIW